MRKIVLSTVFVSAIILLAGCVPKNEYFQSHESFKIDQTNNYILVNDFIDFVEDYYSPSTTKFVIDPKDDFSPFLAVMESRLREKGYGVGYAGMNSAAWLAWKIDRADENTIMVTYHIAESKYSKFYKMDHGKYIPFGTFTVFNEKEKITHSNKKEVVTLKQSLPENKDLPNNDMPLKTETTDAYSVYVKSNSYLHIREEASINSKIIGTLKKGAKIKATPVESKEKWGKLSSIDGCVSMRYLKKNGALECIQDVADREGSFNVSQ